MRAVPAEDLFRLRGGLPGRSRRTNLEIAAAVEDTPGLLRPLDELAA